MNVGPMEVLVILAVAAVPILLIVGVILVVSSSRRRSGRDSMAVLDDRLARGEISPEEYDERRTRLS